MIYPIVYIAGEDICFTGNSIRPSKHDVRLLGNVYRDGIEYVVYASVRVAAKRGGQWLKERFRLCDFTEIKTS